MSEIDRKKSNDSVRHTLIVALAVSFSCAVLVSTTAVLLKPRQLENRLRAGGHQHIVRLIASQEPGLRHEDIVRDLNVRLVDLASGAYVHGIDPATFDADVARTDPDRSIAIPPTEDVAKLNRRAKVAVVYELRRAAGLRYVVLPLSGAGMWSTVRGFVVLQNDFNTIAAVDFHEHGETPGIGDKIQDPDWRAKWRGRLVYDNDTVEFDVTKRAPSGGSAYHVDAITGGTITSESTGAMVRYWLGAHGFQPYLKRLAGAGDDR